MTLRVKEMYNDDLCLSGTPGIEGQSDGKLNAGKSHCVCDRVQCTCRMCVGACTCACDNVHSCMDTCIYMYV